MRTDSYNNNNHELHRLSRKNFPRGSYTKPSFLNSAKNNPQEAMVNTVLGTLNLIEKKNTRKLYISDEDIEKGIEANAQRLGISVDDYHEKMNMITNPQPENDPESEPQTTTETNEPLS